MKLRLFMVFVLGFLTVGIFSGCAELKELLEESEENSYSEDPNSDNYKARYVVMICSIVKYPRAEDLEQEVQCIDGKGIWINTNQNFSSKYLKDAKIIPRPGNPNVCDLQFKLDRLGKIQWQILSGMHIDKKVAFVVDGICYSTFTPEPPNSKNGSWVTLKVGINPYTAKGIVKFAKKNYLYYNPDTRSWF